MVESKRTCPKMQRSSIFGNSPKFCETLFSYSLKIFDSVDMGFTISEFVVSMLNLMTPSITQINQDIIVSPPVSE